MGEMIKMVVVLTFLSIVSGGGLSYLERELKPIQENNIMEMVKGPAVRDLLKGSSNDPIADRFKIERDDKEQTIFMGVFEGKPKILAMESEGKGYGGPVGLIVAIDIDTEQIIGARVTTHTETAGLGSRAKDDPSFTAQFKGKSVNNNLKVTADGGDINALSGATITSRAVVIAADQVISTYREIKPQLMEKLQGSK
jgi:Na+-translocating ferredoxin:NAD+ oxidoreductase subunit G